MFNQIWRQLKKRFKRGSREINPEDIFLDSTNLPGLDRDRFEGRMEEPISDVNFLFVKLVFLFIIVFLGGKLVGLQVVKGASYASVSERNRLDRTVIFADRGVIYDRNKVPLAENGVKSDESDYSSRVYVSMD